MSFARNARLSAARFAAVLSAAFVMRGPVTGTGPLAEEIVAACGTDWAGYGILAAVPIAAFGLGSFAAPALMRRLGAAGASAAALALLVLGAAGRLLPGFPALLAATAVLGGGIALLNVLIPVVIKTGWPERTGRFIGFYTGVIGLSGAAGGLTAAPLLTATGSLAGPFGFWTVCAAAAFAGWLAAFGLRPDRAREGGARPVRLSDALRSPLARCLTAVTGLQSLLVYTVAAWMPVFWRAEGMSAETAGFWLFVFLLSGLPASVATPKFFALCRNDAVAGLALAALYLAGLGGWFAGGVWLPAASVAAGAAQGAMLSAAFLLMARRTRSGGAMLAVSTLAQGAGYLAAGLGPSAFGLIYAASDGRGVPFAALAAVILCWGAAVCLSRRGEAL